MPALARRVLAALVTALLLGGCAGIENLDIRRIFSSTAVDAVAVRIEQARQDATRLLAENRPGPALDRLRQEAAAGVPAAAFPELYPESVNRLVRNADQLLASGDFAGAGDLYRKGLEGYPAEPTLRALIDADVASIREKIDRCADRLLETGLAAYRSGQLEKAIDVWSRIRRFHPDYKASLRAIETTRKQLENLELLRDGPG